MEKVIKKNERNGEHVQRCGTFAYSAIRVVKARSNRYSGPVPHQHSLDSNAAPAPLFHSAQAPTLPSLVVKKSILVHFRQPLRSHALATYDQAKHFSNTARTARACAHLLHVQLTEATEGFAANAGLARKTQPVVQVGELMAYLTTSSHL